MQIIIGFEESNFKTKEGTDITGYQVYLGEENPKVVGHRSAGKQYISTQCFARSGYTPMDLAVGEKISFSYRKYGENYKVYSFSLG